MSANTKNRLLVRKELLDATEEHGVDFLFEAQWPENPDHPSVKAMLPGGK